MPSFINISALIASMISSVVLGFIWYGPLFGKHWMKHAGIKMPDKKPDASMMVKPVLLSFVGALLMTFALASSIAFHGAYYGVSGYTSAVSLAFFLWLGFIVPTYLNFVGWEGKSWTLFAINTGYWLVFLVIVARVIVALG